MLGSFSSSSKGTAGGVGGVGRGRGGGQNVCEGASERQDLREPRASTTRPWSRARARDPPAVGAVARTREGAGHVETTLAVLAQQHADHALVLGVILFRGKGAMRARQSSSFAVFVARRGGLRVSIAAHLLHASVMIDHGQQHQRVHHHLLGLPLGHGHRLGSLGHRACLVRDPAGSPSSPRRTGASVANLDARRCVTLRFVSGSDARSPDSWRATWRRRVTL